MDVMTAFAFCMVLLLVLLLVGVPLALLLCGRLDFHGRHLRDSYQVPVCVGLLANDINIADGSPHVHYRRQPDCGEQHR